jgi:hypothetical protein
MKGFDFMFDIVIADGHTVNLLWHAVEIKDGKGTIRGYLMVSESVKDNQQLKNAVLMPRSHI